MSAITIRMPDEKYQRLKALAQRRGTSINRLVDEMTTLMLAESDLETRFELRAARGQGRQAEGLTPSMRSSASCKPKRTKPALPTWPTSCLTKPCWPRAACPPTPQPTCGG